MRACVCVCVWLVSEDLFMKKRNVNISNYSVLIIIHYRTIYVHNNEHNYYRIVIKNKSQAGTNQYKPVLKSKPYIIPLCQVKQFRLVI